MTIFVKIRQGFTAVLGDVLHGPETILAVTEKEFEAIAHKVEILTEDIAADLHMTKGHPLAVSPARRACNLVSPPATETAATGGAAPTPDAAPAAAGEVQAAAETKPEQAEPAKAETVPADGVDEVKA